MCGLCSEWVFRCDISVETLRQRAKRRDFSHGGRESASRGTSRRYISRLGRVPEEIERYNQPVEGLLAELADVGPGVAVDGLVLAEGRELAEGLAAGVALEVPLIRVRRQVAHQGVLVPEFLRACGKFIRYFSRFANTCALFQVI